MAVAALADRMEAGLPDAENWRRRVDDLARVANTAMVNHIALAKSRVHSLDVQLGALNPVATLNRGFSVVERADQGQVVTSKGQAPDGAPLVITVSDGAFPATVGSSAGPVTPVKKRQATPKKTAKATAMRPLL